MSESPPPINRLQQLPADARVLADALAPVLTSLEQDRQKRLARIRRGHIRIVMVALIAVAVSLLTLVVSKQVASSPHSDLSILAFFPLVAGLIYGYIVYLQFISGHAKRYNATYKEQVIGGLTQLLQPRVNYAPTRGISQIGFENTGLYARRIDRYRCEDLFFGHVDKTEISFSEIHAEEKKQSTNSKGHTQTSWHTIFQGLIFIADFNKDFQSWVTIKPDFAESTFGWLGRKVQNLNSDLVRLENPDFERAFVVHGGDQVEARYILTPDMQERLLKLRQAYGVDIRLALHESKLHLTVPKSENWFEPKMNLAAGNLSQMQTFANQMSWIYGIVHMLDLNTRIWTKD
ncbi:DUF3137 domain-containing protein [Verrucomicrobiaceae bacterium 5K15]|uniref:DUF3137 domain-containing protein n=1 Tax=Oceaniferula flava TaxID=2800421 RepID=A0AAE2VEF7_9BACT|nr:DUF3137 domain-containing protein [Oceaniferula flavus]MBK1855779.1 DUF3137 domain-containing protein [Oceaniferula flavus]MBM1137086.1 DUF3137 domain-containing protein [Oceaniferula flavus]